MQINVGGFSDRKNIPQAYFFYFKRLFKQNVIENITSFDDTFIA